MRFGRQILLWVQMKMNTKLADYAMEFKETPP